MQFAGSGVRPLVIPPNGHIRFVPIQGVAMKTILSPIAVGLAAASHITWYVKYQVTGETRMLDQS